MGSVQLETMEDDRQNFVDPNFWRRVACGARGKLDNAEELVGAVFADFKAYAL